MVTRLALAMLAIAVLSAGAILLSQQIGAAVHFRSLPPDIQARIRHDRERHDPRSDDFAGGVRDVREVQRRFTQIGAAVAAFVALSIAVLLARTISKPVERVSVAAAKVAEGDLSARVPTQPRYASLEAKALTHNFNTMADALETYERERKAMIADIAHELRTPLTAMQLRLEALLDEFVPFDKGEAERLHRQTLLLSRLVQDLRTLSLADAGKLSLHKRDTDLVALVKSVLDSFQERAEQRDVTLELKTAKPSILALVDPDRIAQVMSNLLDNSLRVTPVQGQITIMLWDEPEELTLSVTDTGPGFSKGALEHVFDRFFQDKDTKGSSGLGLAIVQALVTLHGGRVRAGNHASGAQFDVMLPR